MLTQTVEICDLDFVWHNNVRVSLVTSSRPGKGSSPPKKFFSSKNSGVSSNQLAKRRNSDRSDTSESSKPPIVLRICRGKSQLVSDTDEQEKSR